MTFKINFMRKFMSQHGGGGGRNAPDYLSKKL